MSRLLIELALYSILYKEINYGGRKGYFRGEEDERASLFLATFYSCEQAAVEEEDVKRTEEKAESKWIREERKLISYENRVLRILVLNPFCLLYCLNKMMVIW